MNLFRCTVCVLALSLSACSTLTTEEARATAGPPGASPNDHMIQVTVGTDSTGERKIFVDIEELRVRGKDHVVFWRIDNAPGQNYRFASNGIAFKTPEGQAEFKCGPRGALFVCSDPNNTTGSFEYGIRLDGSPSVPPLDPFIINQ